MLVGCFVCLTPVRSFPPLRRRLSLPIYTPGLSLRSRGISEHLPVMCRAETGSPAANAGTPSFSRISNKFMHALFKESGAANPTSKSTTNHLLIVYWSIWDIYIA